MSLSPPSTPSSYDPVNEEHYRFVDKGAPCEWGESYRPDGFLPVHLGDKINDRYKIIRKLGHGSFITVWLAKDAM
jgi:hypothetical protein